MILDSSPPKLELKDNVVSLATQKEQYPMKLVNKYIFQQQVQNSNRETNRSETLLYSNRSQKSYHEL